MVSPRIGLIIVGDEILSGKRRDKHFDHVRGLLTARGLALSWVHYVGDSRDAIAALLVTTFAAKDLVFCCGGIGATPDDHTRQAAGLALGRPLVLHPQAEALIAQRCAEMAAEGRGSADMDLPENRQRLKMGEFPQGARIIDNPYNRIPGFAIEHHHFVPGFPVMAWPMIEAVLDSDYAALFGRDLCAERAFWLAGVPESRATPVMEAIEAQFPGVKVFSLPATAAPGSGPLIELGVKGIPGAIDAAFEVLQSAALRLPGATLVAEARDP